MVGARGWGEEGRRSYCLRDIEFQFYKMKRVVEMDGDDGCTTLPMNLIPVNCTLKNDQGGKFYAAYFITVKN